MSVRHAVILGCGTVGGLAGRILASRGWQVTGLRRSAGDDPGFPLITGDAAEPGIWQRLPQAHTILLTATPGLRRGRDNRLAEAMRAIRTGTRVVYSGTTAVYGEAGGQAVAEDGPLADDAGPLLAVEAAVLAHDDACVLRCPGLIGPTRTRVQERAREAAAAGRPMTVPGDPDRPYSVLHEEDLAELLVEASDGRLSAVRGILNAAHPQTLTVRSYYTEQARRAGVTTNIVSDGSAKPSRAIDAGRLQALLPGYRWRLP